MLCHQPFNMEGTGFVQTMRRKNVGVQIGLTFCHACPKHPVPPFKRLCLDMDCIRVTWKATGTYAGHPGHPYRRFSIILHVVASSLLVPERKKTADCECKRSTQNPEGLNFLHLVLHKIRVLQKISTFYTGKSMGSYALNNPVFPKGGIRWEVGWLAIPCSFPPCEMLRPTCHVFDRQMGPNEYSISKEHEDSQSLTSTWKQLSAIQLTS